MARHKGKHGLDDGFDIRPISEYDGYYGLLVYGHMPVDVGMQLEHDLFCL